MRKERLEWLSMGFNISQLWSGAYHHTMTPIYNAKPKALFREQTQTMGNKRNRKVAAH